MCHQVDMPVVTAHSSYMYWGTRQRREERQEGREVLGEDCSSGEVEDSGRVYSEEVEDSSALRLWQQGEHSHVHLL